MNLDTLQKVVRLSGSPFAFGRGEKISKNTLPGALKKAMKIKEISRHELSTISGVDQSTITKLISGSREARISTVEALFEALEMTWVVHPKTSDELLVEWLKSRYDEVGDFELWLAANRIEQLSQEAE